jgi:hypothetical protein
LKDGEKEEVSVVVLCEERLKVRIEFEVESRTLVDVEGDEKLKDE